MTLITDLLSSDSDSTPNLIRSDRDSDDSLPELIHDRDLPDNVDQVRSVVDVPWYLYPCDNCEPIFVKHNQELDRIPGQNIPCMHCPELFSVPYNPDVHMYTKHVYNTVKSITCQECHKVHDCIHDYEFHLSECSAPPLPSPRPCFKCLLCQLEFSEHEQLENLRRQAHTISFDRGLSASLVREYGEAERRSRQALEQLREQCRAHSSLQE